MTDFESIKDYPDTYSDPLLLRPEPKPYVWNAMGGWTLEEIQHYLPRITYREGWELQMWPTGYSQWFGFNDRRPLVLLVATNLINSRNGKALPRLSTPFLIPEGVIHSRETLLLWVRACCRWFELHESDEWFQYDGEVVFDPHDETRCGKITPDSIRDQVLELMNHEVHRPLRP